MPITLTCPSCNKRLNAEDKHAGRTLKCPACQGAITIPVAGTPASTLPPMPVAVAVNSATSSTTNYKCQNCGSPLVFEQGQDRTVCKYCRSQNLMTVGTDGQITLSLVQKIDSIDNKADQLLAMQKMASLGQLLTTTTNEHLHFLQNEFKPRMVMLEEERDKIDKLNKGCGCAIMAVAVPFCLLMALGVAASDNPVGAFVGLLFLALAGGIVYAARPLAAKIASPKNKLIQEKMDALRQKKADLEKQIGELRSKMSADH